MASKNGKNRKVIRYRRPLQLNIGVIFFLILFVYLIFSVTTALGRKQIRFYEVQAGEMVNDTGHIGMILRTEDVQQAPAAGYVNYYIRDGKRAAVGTKIYALDGNGQLKQFLAENSDRSSSLSEQNVKELKTRLSSFSAGYDRTNFREVYNSRDSVNSVLSEYTSLNVLDGQEEVMRQRGITFTQVTSPESGVVSYSIDGYETKKPEDLTAKDFKVEDYKFSYISAGNQVNAGQDIYKIIPSEDWQVVFPMTEKDQEDYADRTALTVAVKGFDLKLTGEFRMTDGADGAKLGVLTFHQFMVRFSGDRYVTLQIDSGNEDGLKIPVSCVTEKEFFVIPDRFMTGGGNSVEEGFLKQTDAGPVFTPTEIFAEADNECYVDPSEGGPLKAGDTVVSGTGETYEIGEMKKLRGVYNINKGYAVFKKIDIIKETDEYITVSRGTQYGLSVFDHILLDGSEGKEGEPIYQ